MLTHWAHNPKMGVQIPLPHSYSDSPPPEPGGPMTGPPRGPLARGVGSSIFHIYIFKTARHPFIWIYHPPGAPRPPTGGDPRRGRGGPPEPDRDLLTPWA